MNKEAKEREKNYYKKQNNRAENLIYYLQKPKDKLRN